MKKIVLILGLVLCPAFAFAGMAEDYYNAGLTLLQQSDYDKAVQYFHAALRERPDYWEAYQFLGEAYFQSANRTEALVAMEESLKLHPDNPDLRQFVMKVKQTSPWEAKGFWGFGDYLSIFAVLLSLFTLGWTYVRDRKPSPPKV
jgi:tetratricopeptide (TPR) repeat protein